MKAHWYEKAGDAYSVLESGEMEDPSPGPGEVRIKVAYSGVNPYDTKKRAKGRDVEQFGRIIPNCDGSGIIDRVGDGVLKDRIGQSVWVFGAQVTQAFGTGAEYCVIPDLQAIALPKNLSLEEGAALGIPAVTAHRAVFADGDVAGKILYVAGATGRVGSYAVQFSKLAGATVIAATGSNDKIDYLKKLGADYIVNYREEHRIQQVKSILGSEGVDRIIESSFGANIEFDAAVLARHGIIAAFGFDDVGSQSMPHFPLMLKNALLRYIAIFFISHEAKEKTFSQINQIISTGGIQHHIGHIFAFDELPNAHQAIETNEVLGAGLVKIEGS